MTKEQFFKENEEKFLAQEKRFRQYLQQPKLQF